MLFLKKKNIVIITFFLILYSILNTRLEAHHFYNKYYKDFLHIEGQESFGFGPLAIKRGDYFECKDGRYIIDSNKSSLPISPSNFFISNSGDTINRVKSFLLITKQKAPKSPNSARPMIEMALSKTIDIEGGENAYLLYENSKYESSYAKVLKENGLNKIIYKDQVSMRYRDYTEIGARFIDVNRSSFSVTPILQAFRLYCPNDSNEILYRGAAVFKFDHFSNKYGEKVSEDLPAILITSHLYLKSENIYPDIDLLPKF